MFRAHLPCRQRVRHGIFTCSIRNITLDGRNKLSNMFVTLTKEKTTTPSEETWSGHGYLLKAGYIRQSSSGIYSLLPLGLRTIEKIERIIDEEMKNIGGQKLSLPALLVSDNWKKSGRWNVSKGEFFRLKDRKDTDMLLAPTHEEEITQVVASELKSARQLPIRLYQIGRKYRDELRPRAGLLRGREFIMKDLYTFDATVEDAHVSYDLVAQAYRNIFNRVGIPFVVAEADSGNMGGSKSHEYHLISPVGEDTLLTCSSCGYTANEELAVGQLRDEADNSGHASSDDSQIDQRTLNALGLSKEQAASLDLSLLKFTAFDQAGTENYSGVAAVFTRKGRSVNNVKVESAIIKHLEREQLIREGDVVDLKPTDTLPESSKMHALLDDSVPSADLYGILKDRAIVHGPDHYRTAEAGDLCKNCATHELATVKAIEVGHTFYLGTKYSKALNCMFVPTDAEANAAKPAEMGCYGIGISRLLATVAEVCHDDRGIVWPGSIAPYRVCIVPTSNNNPRLEALANQIYDSLENAIFKTKNRETSIFFNDVIIDDRKSGFGAKMTDAELTGYPFIVVLGKKALSDGIVEVNERVKCSPNVKTDVPIDKLGEWLFERQTI